MATMKQILCLLLTAALLITMTACSKKQPTVPSEPEPEPVPVQPEPTESTPPPVIELEPEIVPMPTEPEPAPEPEPEPEPWTWPTDTPDAQGLRADALPSIHATYDSFPLLSAMIVKNGYVVDTYYKDGYDADSRFILNSASKSVTSALVGLAIEHGYLGSVDDRLADYTFELVPETAYSSDDLNWTVNGSRVNREHDDESLRDIALVADSVDNWDEYDTVFIGYPIWWAIAAWPVNNFVKNNDFTGKTVIPFCTSSSSSLGQSGELLAEMAGTGDWQTGERFRSNASRDDVADWVSSLGLN